MFLKIDSLLTKDEVGRLLALSRELTFVDGRISNPANEAKVNLQAEAGQAAAGEAAQLTAAAFNRSRAFNEFAFPRRMALPMLARYEPGMKYAPHADAPFLNLPGVRLRSDISATVFLSEPSSYEGGELVVHLGTEPIAFKGAPGDAIVYPSTLLHEVRPVRAGVRLVAITFVESLIAEEPLRTQLAELNDIAALEGLNMRWEQRVRFEVVRANLMRLWSTG
jgi:PKHD-type hydroxylase